MRVRALLPDRQVEDADAFERSLHRPILARRAASVQKRARLTADPASPTTWRDRLPARLTRHVRAARSGRPVRPDRRLAGADRGGVARGARAGAAAELSRRASGSSCWAWAARASAAACCARSRSILARRRRVDVVRGYTLPAYVDERTLVIASSNSGNTEEVVATFDAGDPMPERSASRSRRAAACWLRRASTVLPALTFAWEGEPRSALGWSFASLLAICGRLGLIPDVEPDLVAGARAHAVAGRADRSRRAGGRESGEAARAAARRHAAGVCAARRRWRRWRIAGARRSTRTRSRGRSPTSCRR